MIKIFPILTYLLYWLLLFLFVFDYENYNQALWETVTNYWCFAFIGYFFGILITKSEATINSTISVDSFTVSVFITILLLAGLDLLWYTTPISDKYNLPIYTACYFTILLLTFVFNEIFKKNENRN